MAKITVEDPHHSHILGIECVCRGFTKFARTDYAKWKEENRIVSDGVNAKVCLT